MASASAIGIEQPLSSNRPLLVVSVMLAAFMHVLDATVANVVLPHMQGSLSASRDTISWVLTSYIVAAAVMMPMSGWATAKFGRRRLFLSAIAVFTVSSMLCGMATTLPQMVVFRLIQGISGAALIPLSQTIVLDAYPQERHGQMMSIWGAGIMIGPILGPTVGGWLADVATWRWVFYINVPVGILAFLGVSATLNKDEPKGRSFDILGFILLVAGLGAFQLALDRGELKDWFQSREIIIEMAIAVSCLWMFAVHSLTSRSSVVDMRIFLDRNYTIGLMMGFILGFVLVAVAALLPSMMQDLLNYPTMTAGTLITPRGVGTMIAMIITGRLMGRFDPRAFAALGFTLISLSLYQMTVFDLSMDAWPFIYSGFTQGLGLGFGFASLTTISFSTMPSELRPDGTAIFSLLRNLGSSVGVSVVVALLSRSTQINHAEIGERVSDMAFMADSSIVQQSMNLGAGQAVGLLNAEVTRQALMIAYLNDFKLMMLVSLLCAPLAYLMRRPKRPVTDMSIE